MDKKQQISYALVTLMDTNGTQGKELAEYLGVTPSAISNYRNGTRSIDVEILAKICDYYGISLNDITNDEMFSPNETVNYAVVDFPQSDKKEKMHFHLTDDEKEIITLYRSLPEIGRRMVLTGLREYANRE